MSGMGIGRQKELNLDEAVERWRYVRDELKSAIPSANYTGDLAVAAALVVAADVVHDVEKKLASLFHVLESR